MGAKTKIDWCDATWNPVTGCLHGCKYCYANRIAVRFGGATPDNKLHALEELNRTTDGKPDPYPFGFAPTLHLYRLGEPKKWKTPKNIFVCSMADLFGRWVPDSWKFEVLAACAEAPQHRYLFLTKNPDGIEPWNDNEIYTAEKYPVRQLMTDNMWHGISWTGLNGRPVGQEDQMGREEMDEYFYRMCSNVQPFIRHRFLSIEPMLTDVCEIESGREPGRKLLEVWLHGWDTPYRIPGKYEWVIAGAETGYRAHKVVPRKEWVMKLAELCRENGIPLFMKESLREIMGADFRQEFPW